ncbi:3-dehydroquinate synthase II [Streptomyces scopuliridis]|uniref:3-dehydroquinate synthase II n=1 Tax=Streptomyces scopuliridis TaxID=452529 RepID=UPI0036CC139C
MTTDVIGSDPKRAKNGRLVKAQPKKTVPAAAPAAAPAPPSVPAPLPRGRKFTWHDLRRATGRPGGAEILDAVQRLHSGGGVVVDEEQLALVPQGLQKVKLFAGVPSQEELDRIGKAYDVLVLDADTVAGNWFIENKSRIGIRTGASVDVVDPASLELAVQLTGLVDLLVVTFKDSTKIPLEIVLADAQNRGCQTVMGVRDSAEAHVVFGVLEIGADGVLVEGDDLAAVHRLHEVLVAAQRTHSQRLQQLTVVETRHAGMGDRACLDFTSYLGLDEGVLLGCFSSGGVLATSETHALPYMPTRPFRVNAGALHMYVLAPDNRTWYLSDLRAGMEVLAVRTDGTARPVTVGRVKIERRPMLEIIARADDGTEIITIMQEDWHVRIFGTDSKPRNITELQPGDRVFGFTQDSGRHVGVKVDELIIEQ